MICIVLMCALFFGFQSKEQDQKSPDDETQEVSENDPAVIEERIPKVLLWAEVTAVKDNLATIDVFVDTVSDLRGYQVAVEVRGKSGGAYKLSNASVSTDREDYAFAGLFSFNAVDLNVPARLAGVLMAGGVSIDGVAYLGTFDFEVPKDINEPFDVVLQEGENTLLRDSNAEPIAFTVVTPVLPKPALVSKGQKLRDVQSSDASAVESQPDKTTHSLE